jgi:hypothetical protein
MTSGNDEIIGDGNMPTALTDLRDIGRYMAMIISDPRTLNKKILAYNLVSSQNKIYELMEELSEEKIDRNYVSCTDSRLRNESMWLTDFFFFPEHRFPKKPSAAESWRPDKPVKPIHSTQSSSFHGIWLNINCLGESAATTTPSTPSILATTPHRTCTPNSNPRISANISSRLSVARLRVFTPIV